MGGEVTTTSFVMLGALGAFHGINPGMGWLFAVALGMQEGRRIAVYSAMLSLALGHALAIAAAVAVAMVIGAVVPLQTIQWSVSGVLLVLGVSRFVRHRHPRWVRMRVSRRDLTLWSFLMASAHGAGLMVLPLVLGAAAPHHHHHMTGAANASVWSAAWAIAIHSAGYLSASSATALVVFEKLGVGVLRKAWINLDVVWALALVVTSAAALLVP